MERRFSGCPLLQPVIEEGEPSSSGNTMETVNSGAHPSIAQFKFQKASTSQLGVPKKRGHKFKKHYR